MKEISVFDIIGPIMIGPSSSHTAGALRIALIAGKIAGGQVRTVRFKLYGSFSKTYQGHGTDRALLAGIMGFDPGDYRIRDSFSIARERGIDFSFEPVEEIDVGMHPNTVDIFMTDERGEETSLRGCSVGGGNIEIVEINGVNVRFTGEYNAILVTQNDKPGVLAHVCKVLEEKKVNIAYMRVYRKEKGSRAYSVIEIDGSVGADVIETLREQPDICSVRYVEK